MNLRRDRRVLRGIERDLAQSDPGLSTLFVSFAAMVKDAEMPGTEKIEARPLRLFELLGRCAGRHRAGEHWRARVPDESLTWRPSDVHRDGGV